VNDTAVGRDGKGKENPETAFLVVSDPFMNEL
jgi:hypothetical protein